MGGEVVSNLIYRDRFNPFGKAHNEDNLIQSEVPAHDRRLAPVVSFFGVRVDVNRRVRLSGRAQLLFVAVLVSLLRGCSWCAWLSSPGRRERQG